MSDDAEHWRRVRDLFDRALDASPDRRDALFAVVSPNDASLVSEVRVLLAAHDRNDSPLEGALNAGELFGDGNDSNATADDWTGRRVGAYRIEREIGRGGMGTVYEAKRDDAEFEQRVAIKLIRAGAESESIVRRFRRERQILAALHHPNIARLMDGAVLPDGHPYLVMELVDGEPIDRYCDMLRLTIRQRLELFLGVCDAVDHAHRNLVIHRDLKPRNILVTPDGVPKLLDFGIAKLVRPDAGDDDAATLTVAGFRFFTPEYASPEQLRDDPMTTRSDVYSLGVILYELLCGARPFGDAGRSLGDIEKILTTEPLRPSAVVSDAAARDRSNVDASALKRRLSGELDNIVLMALRKEPERRYTSVEQFAEDLRRYLDGRTVIAQTDTTGYRIRKFVGRHRAGVVAVSIVTLAVGGGLATTLWQARVARIERTKSDQITTFLTSVLGSANPAWYTTGPRPGPNTTVVEALHLAGLHVGTDFADHPDVEARVRRTIGKTYVLLGVPDSAEPQLRTAVALQRRASPGPSLELARDLEALAGARYLQGHFQDAIAFGREARVMYDVLGDTASLDVAELMNDLSVIERNSGNVVVADTESARALAIHRRILGEDSPGVANDLSNRATIQADRHDFPGAERSMREAVAIYARHPDREFSERGMLLLNLSTFRTWDGAYAEADSLAHASFDVFMRTLGAKSPNTSLPLSRLAYMHHLEGKDSVAEGEIIRARAMLAADGLPPNHPEMTRAAIVYGMVLTGLGKLSVADTMLRHALAYRLATYKPEDWHAAEAMVALGVTLAAEGKTVEADSLLSRGRANFEHAFGKNDPRTKWAAHEEATAYSRITKR